MPATKRGRPTGAKIWADAIRKAVCAATQDPKARVIDVLADRLVTAALAGDTTAAKEIGDRLDGKPHQTSETVAEVKHVFVVETPAIASDVEQWQKQHGETRLIQ
jgi:hypothetical protein